MWAEHWNPSICLETPHLWHLSSLLRIYLGLNVFLFSNSFSLYGACCWLTSFEYPMFLDLNLLFLNCFHLALFGGISVFWCLNRFTWVACGTLDIFLMCLVVDLEDSNFLASCLTLLAGNFSRSILESLIVSETNYSSIRKTKTCLCVVLAISCGCGYFARLIWACTVLYHSSTLISPCLKFVKWSNHALTSFVWDLQNSSNLFQITSKHKCFWGKHQDTYWSIPKSPVQATTFLHFLVSDNIASSQSSTFLHLIFHLRNLWYKLSSKVQSIFGPFIYGIYIGYIACIWLVNDWINCELCITTSSSCSWSELASSCSLLSSGRTYSMVDCSNWALLVAFGILRLWFEHFQVSFNHVHNLMQAVKWHDKLDFSKLVFNLYLVSSLWDSGIITQRPHPL